MKQSVDMKKLFQKRPIPREVFYHAFYARQLVLLLYLGANDTNIIQVCMLNC